MTQPALPVSLADIQRQYEEALARQNGAPTDPQLAPFAPPPPTQPAPQPAPATPPPGFYQASDGRFYPLSAQPQAAPAPAPQPAPVAAPAPLAPAPLPSGFSIPPQQAQALATQHAQQTLPINPPEAQQALLPEAQATMPEPKRKRGGGRKPATAAAGETQTQADATDLSGVAFEELAAELGRRGFQVDLRWHSAAEC